MKHNKFWKRYLNEAEESQLPSAVTSDIQDTAAEIREREQQKRKEEQAAAQRAAEEARKRKEEREAEQAEAAAEAAQKREEDLANTISKRDEVLQRVNNAEELVDYFNKRGVNITPAEAANTISSINNAETSGWGEWVTNPLNRLGKSDDQRQAKEKLAHWLVQANRNTGQQISQNMIDDEDNIYQRNAAPGRNISKPNSALSPNPDREPNGAITNDPIWADWDEEIDEQQRRQRFNNIRRRGQNYSATKTPNELDSGGDDYEEEHIPDPEPPSYWDRAKSYATNNPGKTAAGIAAGAAGLGAAAYAMRRLMLRKKAKQLQDKSMSDQERCNRLSGRDKKECLDRVDENTLKSSTSILKDCANTDDPDKCEREIQMILSL